MQLEFGRRENKIGWGKINFLLSPIDVFAFLLGDLLQLGQNLLI